MDEARIAEELQEILSRLETENLKLNQMHARMDRLEQAMERIQEKEEALNNTLSQLNHEMIPRMNLAMKRLDELLDLTERLEQFESVQQQQGQRIFALENRH